MKFEWDEAKNRENIRKHGIDFVDVSAMFGHPLLMALDRRKEYGEDRWLAIGRLRNVLAVVVITERGDDVVRIISARKANKHERETYEKAIAD